MQNKNNENLSLPDNIGAMITNLAVINIEKSIELYTNLFGFEIVECAENDEGNIIFAILTYQNSSIMLHEPKAYKGQIPHPMTPPIEKDGPLVVTFYLYTNNVREKFKEFQNHNLTILHEPTVQFWGDTTLRIKDINGYIWDFAEFRIPYESHKM
ncbi:MAG: VOC family protein [Sphingobacteriia bacterium]|nr:VOC family protein [Sphingobacteriia bacterium]